MRALSLLLLAAAALDPAAAKGAHPSRVTAFQAGAREIRIFAFQGGLLPYEMTPAGPVPVDAADLPAPARDALPCRTRDGAATVSWKALSAHLRTHPLPRPKEDRLYAGTLARSGRRWRLVRDAATPPGRAGSPPLEVPEPGGPAPAPEAASYVLLGLPGPAPVPGPILLLGHVDTGAASADQGGEVHLAVTAWARP
ncbi:hypothetical protein [Mesoterricola sediminis]|uniref:Uncharacterized protein n=1 Tax=Mesoterricola sediminis TaxID=2927980 RepID=A0AA48H3A5_9BACT|nr:hypothetical protein [Mesoterricola sediminis]BDU76681.1 hypothetical protein METESE_16390 [Mesoterricola sediminis]